MPQNPHRRTQILDTAIEILADAGVGGLTHRAVDERGGLPTGTTSNYFRTRLALLEATAAHTVDLHWRRVEFLRSNLGPLSREGVRQLMTRMIAEPDEQARRYTLARFELFMEGTRRPELQPFLTELRAAMVKSATVIFESAGLRPTPDRMEELSRLLNGLVFSNLTLPPEPGDFDPADLVDRIVRTVLES